MAARRQRPPAEAEAEKDFTVDEVAKLVRMHPQTVRRWIKRGELRAFRSPAKPRGGRLRIAASELARFRAQHQTTHGRIPAPRIEDPSRTDLGSNALERTRTGA